MADQTKMPPGQYHPDPEIDAEIRAEHIKNELSDRALGLGISPFGQRTCSSCGWANHDIRKNCRECGAVLPDIFAAEARR